jgi:hypothetical protein
MVVELLPYATLFSIYQVVTVFLVGAILFFTLKAYRMTSHSFLIAFFIGFVLLEISFTFVFLNRLFGQTGAIYHGTLWVHEIIQTGAFAFIASTYYLRNKNLTLSSVEILALIFLGILVSAFFIYLSFPPDIAFSWRGIIALYLYAIGLGLLAYIIYNVLETFTRTSQKTSQKKSYSSFFIPAGFGTLAIGQALWVYWGITDAGLALLLANLLLVIGLALLTVSVAIIWRR